MIKACTYNDDMIQDNPILYNCEVGSGIKYEKIFIWKYSPTIIRSIFIIHHQLYLVELGGQAEIQRHLVGIISKTM